VELVAAEEMRWDGLSELDEGKAGSTPAASDPTAASRYSTLSTTDSMVSPDSRAVYTRESAQSLRLALAGEATSRKELGL